MPLKMWHDIDMPLCVGHVLHASRTRTKEEMRKSIFFWQCTRVNDINCFVIVMFAGLLSLWPIPVYSLLTREIFLQILYKLLI